MPNAAARSGVELGRKPILDLPRLVEVSVALKKYPLVAGSRSRWWLTESSHPVSVVSIRSFWPDR
ncbi:MAG: hypothetical protein ACOH2Q_22480 [Rhodococcus sp. (in: high G+C Gram-positive bacteria)]